jgi:hypothetical protein
MDFAARLSPESTDMAIPTSWADSTRRCAVTTISCRSPLSFAKAPAPTKMAPAPAAAAINRMNIPILLIPKVTICAHHRWDHVLCEVLFV